MICSDPFVKANKPTLASALRAGDEAAVAFFSDCTIEARLRKSTYTQTPGVRTPRLGSQSEKGVSQLLGGSNGTERKPCGTNCEDCDKPRRALVTIVRSVTCGDGAVGAIIVFNPKSGG